MSVCVCVYESRIDLINIIDSKHMRCYNGGNLTSSSYYTDAVQNSIHIVGEIIAAENIPLVSSERKQVKRERDMDIEVSKQNYTTYFI